MQVLLGLQHQYTCATGPRAPRRRRCEEIRQKERPCGGRGGKERIHGVEHGYYQRRSGLGDLVAVTLRFRLRN